jgi:NADPH:quinone reductase-like Zn-dependent oxidoreductase
MRAWVFDRYGSADALALREVPFPSFHDEHEILVHVDSASVNPVDRHLLHPFFLFRRKQGLLRPKSGRLGADFAGRVELVGKEVKELRVGDFVFGLGRGSFGEYAVADETQVAVKPAALACEQAAAAPIAGITALQALRDHAQVRPGQRVLINGSSGGVGTFAVQIAKWLGADVSCVCSPQNVEQTRSLGATRVFDYTREDFTQSGERFDVILDTQLNHSLGAYRRALVPGGLLVIVGGGPGSIGKILPRLLVKIVGSRIMGPRTKFFIASVKRPDLAVLAEVMQAGKVTAVIDRRYAFEQVPDAVRYLTAGHARGKIIVTVAKDSTAPTVSVPSAS